jgi:SMI1 / KNR4 family (SUKH-1)
MLVLPLKTIKVVDTELRFELPELLRMIYTKVGNGGFGPGYGLIGVPGGAIEDGKTINEHYQSFRSSDPDDPKWKWPEKLLPICHWGCAIYACVDCSRPEAPVITFDPNCHDLNDSWDDCFRQSASSLQEWLTAWLNGVDLWEQMYPGEKDG